MVVERQNGCNHGFLVIKQGPSKVTKAANRWELGHHGLCLFNGKNGHLNRSQVYHENLPVEFYDNFITEGTQITLEISIELNLKKQRN